MEYRLFTSESVSEGHPDKLADQISDAILDAILTQKPQSRVACEALVKTGLVLVAGEIKSECYVNIEKIVRNVINDAGYTHSDYGMDGNSCGVINVLGEQSINIAQGVDQEDGEIGAGDQGMMFGYATNETDTFMPMPITYAHKLVRRQAQVRRKNIPWLRPDAKSQITFRYDKNNKPVAIDAVILSTQHDEDKTQKEIEEVVHEMILKPVLPSDLLHSKTKYHINPAGPFVVGGPQGDCGLTGRKIIVDSYGGVARHGGGAFSGKDPSKVDRSGAYAARYVAKNIVAAGLADKCEVQLSYAIGKLEPISVAVNHFGTGKISDEEIAALIKKHFDLSPKGIIQMLDLERPIYRQTATYGHFGRDDLDLSWEKTDKASLLKG